MSCQYYNNNGFGCGGCTHFVRTNSVTLSSGTLVLNIPVPQVQLTNKQRICICVAQAIPTNVTSANGVVVTIGTGTKQYSLMTKSGNYVHADQVRSRKVYHTDFATDSLEFVVSGCQLCPTGFNFPVITP